LPIILSSNKPCRFCLFYDSWVVLLWREGNRVSL